MNSIMIEESLEGNPIDKVAKRLSAWLKERKYHFLLHTLKMKSCGINRTDGNVIVEYEMEKHANDFLDNWSKRTLDRDTEAGWFK